MNEHRSNSVPLTGVLNQRGHAVGDQVLVHVARTTVSALREIDRVPRFGGEDFITLLSGTMAERSNAVAQRTHALLFDAATYGTTRSASAMPARTRHPRA